MIFEKFQNDNKKLVSGIVFCNEVRYTYKNVWQCLRVSLIGRLSVVCLLLLIPPKKKCRYKSISLVYKHAKTFVICVRNNFISVTYKHIKKYKNVPQKCEHNNFPCKEQPLSHKMLNMSSFILND